MMAAGKAETVDFKRKEVPEMLREKIRKKLKSEQGTSIFFGLLLFLVASILSVVMLEARVLRLILLRHCRSITSM